MPEYLHFSNQSIRKTPSVPSSSGPSWKERLAGAALVAGTLGGAYRHFSDDHHQEVLNASVPDRTELARREAARSRAEGVSATEQRRGPRSREVWDRLNQAWQEETDQNMAAAEEEPAPVHERSEIEIASETGRAIIADMLQSGEYLRYFGRARDFNNEVMRRIAEDYGIPYDPDNLDRQPFIAARYAIQEELEAQSRLSLDHAHELQAQGHSTDQEITNAIHTRALGSYSDGATLALRNGRGDLTVDCIRQSNVDIHDPTNEYVWGGIVPPNAPGATEEALAQTWRYLDAEDRAMIERRIRANIHSLETWVQMTERGSYDDPAVNRVATEDVARDRQKIADFRRILDRWF